MGGFSEFKNEITICQGELEAKIAEDYGLLDEETRECEIERKRGPFCRTDAARNSRAHRRHYSAPTGHSAGGGHALAAAAFFSGQIGQSMHLPVPIPICHCPPGPVPLSPGDRKAPAENRKDRAGKILIPIRFDSRSGSRREREAPSF